MPASEVVENAVRESESWFRALANSAPVLIWSSGPDGLCTYFNERWLRFTGRTLEESVGEGWVRDVHPDDRDRVLDEYKQAFQAHEEFRLEYRLRQHGKGYKWIVDFGSPVFRQDEGFLGYVGSCIAMADGETRETNWRQKYEAVRGDDRLAGLPDRILAAEVAVRERLEQICLTEEQTALRVALADLLALKKDKLDFSE